MDPFRRNQEERFTSGWNRDFLAHSDGLALERNAGIFHSGRDLPRPFEFSGMLGSTGRQFAGREEVPTNFASRGGPLTDFRSGDRMALDFQGRNLQPRELPLLDFRAREALAAGYRGREAHPLDFRSREGLMMDYRERDGTASDLRNRELPLLEFKDRDVPRVDYREREPLADFRSREASSEFRGRSMLDMDFRSKELPHPDMRGMNPSDKDFRNRNHPFPDFRSKDGSTLEFLGNSSSALDFRGKDASQMDARTRDVLHSDFRDSGTSDLDFRARDAHMFNFQGSERPRTDQDFRDRDATGAPVDFTERSRPPSNQTVINYMHGQTIVPDQEVHEGSVDKTGDPPVVRLQYNQEKQTNDQDRDGQAHDPSQSAFKSSDGQIAVSPAQEESSESLKQSASTGEQQRAQPGRGVKRGVDLDFLGRQDTDYRNIDYQDVDLRFDYNHGKPLADERAAKDPRHDLQMSKPGRGTAKSTKIGQGSTPHTRSAKEEHAARSSGEEFDGFVQRISSTVSAALDPKNTKVTDVDQDYRPASSGEECASRFIQIQGLPAAADKEEILDSFRTPDGNPIEDLQLSDYNPGYSHDSVCVEFPLLEQAIGCMESNQGSMVIGGIKVSLTYVPDPTDWFCEKCKAINVYSGGFCFQCNTSRHESEAISRQKSLAWEKSMAATISPQRSESPPRRERDLDRRRAKDRRRHQLYDDDQVECRNQEYDGAQGTCRDLQHDEDHDDDDQSKTMMIRPILCSTTPMTVVKAFAPFVHIRPENVRIIMNSFKGKAKTFGFIEMESHEEVLRVIDILATMKPPLKIDGKCVTGSVANRKPTGHSRTKRRKQPVWLSPGFATQTAKRSIYLKRRSAGGSKGAGESDENETDDSSFIYDPDTGLYIDPLSGVCYDPDTKEEFPVGEKPDPSKASEKWRDTRGETGGSSRTPERKRHRSQEGSKRKVEPSDSEKTRDRVEHRRRERVRSPPLSRNSRNKDRDSRRSTTDQKEELLGGRGERKGERKAPRTGKATFTEKDDSEDETPPAEDPFKKPLLPVFKKKEASPPPPAPAPAPVPPPPPPPPPPVPVVNPLISLLGEYGGDSDNEEEEEEPPPPPPRKPQPPPPPPPPPAPKKEESNEDKLTDWIKLACLLCKRQFPTKEGLIRHQQLSELHQQNMAIHRKIKQSERELEYLEMKEREVKLKGSEKRDQSEMSPETKRPKYLRDVERDSDSPIRSDAGGDTKVRRTPQATWKKGVSKPRRRPQDRKSPGEEDDQTEGADQEPQTKPYKRLPHESYRDAARKVMFARFKELV
ncbi:hypothetical protein NDU88_006590 [Pleurodeles waltl]|uniref:C2H2-type domain-containing protein n=2 Tax=Pleurodeles waltl TaxID=8319 RepID=A0AAV7MZX6_PLEWA|nr:hypothetical protein NDU88_006590 [Pleurodeles waltl]